MSSTNSSFIANINAPSPVRWDLSIQLDGITYPIRELTVRELSDLTVRSMPREEQIAVAKGLFSGNQPPEGTFEDDDARQRLYHYLGAYVVVLGEKKAKAALEAVRAAMV
jgi:hypothetical protein